MTLKPFNPFNVLKCLRSAYSALLRSMITSVALLASRSPLYIRIQEAPGVTVFHKVDSEFKVPKASFHFELARYSTYCMCVNAYNIRNTHHLHRHSAALCESRQCTLCLVGL